MKTQIPDAVRCWLLALLLVSTVAPVQAGHAPEQRLTLVVTTGISGQLVDAGGTTLAAVAATVKRIAESARDEGSQVLILDAGRTLAPYAESRWDSGRTVFAVLEAAGCTVFAPSALDFSLGAQRLEERAGASRVTVLRPFEAGSSNLEAAALVELDDGEPLRVISLMDRGFAGDLAAAGIVEPTMLTPAAGHAGLVMAVVHSRGHGRQVTNRSLTWDLVDDPGDLDLVIDPDFGRDAVMRLEGEHGPLALVGLAHEGERGWTVARIDLVLDAASRQVASATLELVTPDGTAAADPALVATVNDTMQRFRQAHAEPLPGGAPGTWEGLGELILKVARETARAEVAILPRGSIRPVDPSLFEGPAVPSEALLRMLSIDQRLVAVRLPGSALAELATLSARRTHADGTPRKDSLHLFGVTYDVTDPGTPAAKATNIKVNGRPLRVEDAYRVAVNTYLLSGGGGYAPLAGRDPLPVHHDAASVTLDEAVATRMTSLEQVFADLDRKPLWRYGADRIGFTFEGVETSHDEAYASAGDSRARASSSSSLLAEVKLRADRELPAWRWENRLRARFGFVDAEGTAVRESDDDIQLESSAVFSEATLLRGGHPFAGVNLDSELRPNRGPDGTALPRQFEQTLSAGLSWSLPHWPRLRLGAVVRHYSQVDLAEQVGLSAEATFKLEARRLWPGVEGRLFVEHLSDGDRSVQRADLDLRLLFPVRGALVFTPAFNYYLYDDSTLPGVAKYGRLSLGLLYSWHGKHQSR